MRHAQRNAPAFRRTLLFAVVLGLGAPCLPLPTAQGQVVPMVGNKVRVTAPDLGLSGSIGFVSEVDDGTLVVAFNGGLGGMSVGMDKISTLEISSGQRSRAWEGALIGLLAGGGFGAVIGNGGGNSSACAGEPSQGIGLPTRICVRVTRGFKRGMGAVAGGLLGAGIGARIGKMLKTERWMFTNIGSGEISAQLLAGQNGLGLTLGISF